MDKLPAEILFDIFLLLHQIDKVNCMMVCRKWEYTINQFCLFHTLCISTRRQTKQLLKKFKREPHKGEHVERIIIFGKYDLGPDIIQLLSFFQNPREICLPTAELTEKMARSEVFKNSSRYIRHLSEYNGIKMTTKLLECNICSHLETLTLSRLGRHVDVKEVIDTLDNAPVLKNLRLDCFEIYIEALEELHKKSTLIESVYFNNTIVITKTWPVLNLSDMDIQPAISVTSFRLGFRSASDISITTHLLKYFVIKYTNLEELEFDHAHVFDYLHLTEFEKTYLYTNALKPLCQKLGPQLKRLKSFSIDKPQNLFKWMDVSGCQIQELNIDVSSSNWTTAEFIDVRQPIYIQKLTLREFTCGQFRWLNSLIGLKELRLSFYEPKQNNVPRSTRLQKLNLNYLLKECPDTLTTIALTDVEIQNSSSIIELPSVKHLELTRVSFSEGVDTFISETFPALRILKLIYCGLAYKTISFPDLRLFYLYIEDIYTKRRQPVETLLVKSLNNKEHRLYKKMRFRAGENRLDHQITRYDKTLYPENKLLKYDPSSCDPLITFECASVKNVAY